MRPVFAHREILGSVAMACPVVLRPLSPKTLLVAIHPGKPGIPLPEMRVRHIAVDALFQEHLDIGLRVKAAVRRELRGGEGISRDPDGREVLPHPLNHRLQQVMLLRHPKGFGVYHNLVLGVHDRHSIISLDHTMRGLHLGTFIVGEITLNRFAALARLVLMVLQPLFDLLDPLSERVDILHFLHYRFCVALASVDLTVPLHELSEGLLHLLFLLPQVFRGPTPFLRGIRRQLAAVDSKHLLPDQPQLVADEQDVKK